MTFLYSFYTELVIFFGIIYFFVLGLGLRSSWNQVTFSSFIFNQLIIILLTILVALCITEGHWHFILHPLVPSEVFYPTTLLTTTFLSFVSKVFLLLLTIACVLLHKPTAVLRSKIAVEYSILVLFITLASFLLMSSADLAFAFIAMELQTLSLIAFSFIGHQRKTITAEAIFRYFINAAFASVSFLFSISLFYSLTGTLNIECLVALLEINVLTSVAFFILLQIAAVLLFFAFFFKLTLVPFHHWVGDLYQGTSGYVGSYFTLVTKLPLWVLLVKIMLIFLTPTFSTFFWTQNLLKQTGLIPLKFPIK